MTTETWKDISGYPGYQISRHGDIRSCWLPGSARRLGSKWHPVKLKPTRDGHLQVRLRRKSFYVHRLVLATFVGPCPEGHECCHADDNPSNNNIENLSWGTRNKNISDRFKNGWDAYGETHKSAKVTDKQALEIRGRAATGETYSSIAKDYPVSPAAIGAIAKGRRFKHLPGSLPPRKAVRSMVDEGLPAKP
jgi:hypothetical protein